MTNHYNSGNPKSKFFTGNYNIMILANLNMLIYFIKNIKNKYDKKEIVDKFDEIYNDTRINLEKSYDNIKP